MTHAQTPQYPGQDDAGPEEIRDSAPVLPPSSEFDEEPYYLLEEEQNGALLETQHAPQFSRAMPPLDAAAASHLSDQIPPLAAPSAQRSRKRRKPPLLLVAGLATVVVVLLLALVMTAFAAQMTPRSPATATTGVAPLQPTAKPKPVPTPGVKPTPQVRAAQAGPPDQAATWTANPLPDGWTNAGLLKPDEVEADRTGLAFTDREMELDFRNAGTRAAHAGTFTAALFILTPAAKARFQQNDVRVINDALFDRVAQQQLIEAAVDETPKLVKFQVQGNQQFAWIDVSFHLWQSRIDPNNAQHRIEGLDQGTKQPRVHHMTLLLLRVAPNAQGPAAPMGGTGWLVSTYALDLPGSGLPDIVEPA